MDGTAPDLNRQKIISEDMSEKDIRRYVKK